MKGRVRFSVAVSLDGYIAGPNGGGELFCSLLELRLVDSVELAVIPVLLGAGLPLLPHPARQAKLKLINHRIYPKTGTVFLEYAPV